MGLNFDTVLIARNEAETLPRLLQSLEAFRDQGGAVILVDTGSTDGTAEVARNWGCKVEEVGDRFRRTITADEAQQINARFVVEGEQDVVAAGDSLFDYSSARNYAASLASNDWVWMPDCDEVFTSLDLDAIKKIMEDPTVDRVSYDFVFAHDIMGLPTISFLHSKCYRRSKMRWCGIVHEILQDIPYAVHEGLPAPAGDDSEESSSSAREETWSEK